MASCGAERAPSAFSTCATPTQATRAPSAGANRTQSAKVSTVQYIQVHTAFCHIVSAQISLKYSLASSSLWASS
jgi:hypothetical protein